MSDENVGVHAVTPPGPPTPIVLGAGLFSIPAGSTFTDGEGTVVTLAAGKLQVP
jgi:hypothetical protein